MILRCERRGEGGAGGQRGGGSRREDGFIVWSILLLCNYYAAGLKIHSLGGLGQGGPFSAVFSSLWLLSWCSCSSMETGWPSSTCSLWLSDL